MHTYRVRITVGARRAMAPRRVVGPRHTVTAMPCDGTFLRHDTRCALRGSEEGGGGLDNINVLVQMSGQRPLWGADDGGAIVVAKDGVGGVEERLDLFDGQDDGEPVFCRGEDGGVNAVLAQPGVDEVDGAVGGGDQVADLCGRQVLAITLVRGIGDLNGVLLEDVLVAVSETNLKLDGVGSWSARNGGPADGDRMALLECVEMVGSGRNGNDSAEQGRHKGEGGEVHECGDEKRTDSRWSRWRLEPCLL